MNIPARVDNSTTTHRISNPFLNKNRGDEKPLPESLLRRYEPEDLVILSRDTAPHGSWRDRFWQNQGKKD